MITRLAAAKVNLDLRVTGRRVDGYHELDSLVVFTSVGDVLTFEPAAELTLHLEGPYADHLRSESLQDNLVLRAAELMQARDKTSNRRGARITLTKNLPVAAGLGGGSADAAATLSGIAELWGFTVNAEELAQIGLKLGADVPVCLQGGPCYLGGIGEKIVPLERFPRLPIVLVNPGLALSTPQVFGVFDGNFSSARTGETTDPAAGFDSLDDLLGALADSRNDLERPAVGLVPEIADCLTELRAAPGCPLARMSGSGASCFGLFPSTDAAKDAARLIQMKRPGWWVVQGVAGKRGDDATLSSKAQELSVSGRAGKQRTIR